MTKFWYWNGNLHQMEIIDNTICYVDKPYQGIFFFHTKEDKTRFLELRHITTGAKMKKQTSLNASTAHTNVSPNYKGNKLGVTILIRGMENNAYLLQSLETRRLMPQKAREYALDWAYYNPYIKDDIEKIFVSPKRSD